MAHLSRVVRLCQTLGRVNAGPSCHSLAGCNKLQYLNSSTSRVSSRGLRKGQGNLVPFHLLGERTVSHRATTFDNAVLKVAKDHLLMRDEGLGSVKIPFCWLRHNCRCPTCFHAGNAQILHNIEDLDLDIKVTDVQSDSHGITVTFSDSHRSVFSHAWLRKHAHGMDSMSYSGHDTFRTLWKGSRLTMPSFNFSDIRKDNSNMQKLLQMLYEYGVVLITGVEPSEEFHVNVARFVMGGIQSTFFGTELAKTTPGKNEADHGYTNDGIPLHTDMSFFSPPLRGLTLQVLERSGDGGRSIISDGFYAIERLRSNHPEYFRILCDTDLLTHYVNDDKDIRSSEPTITINPRTKQIERIRFNLSRTTVTNVSYELMVEFYRALQILAKEIYDDDNAFKILLKPDQLMILDNWRVLHARESFTGHRVLVAAYQKHEEWMSQMRKIGGLNV